MTQDKECAGATGYDNEWQGPSVDARYGYNRGVGRRMYGRNQHLRVYGHYRQWQLEKPGILQSCSGSGDGGGGLSHFDPLGHLVCKYAKAHFRL